jgi:hypothetical protein
MSKSSASVSPGIRVLGVVALVVVTIAGFGTAGAGADPAAGGSDPIKPFNGQNLQGWKLKPHARNISHWAPGSPAVDPADPRQLQVDATRGDALVNVKGHGLDIYTEVQFGDAVIDLEVLIPQGSNSGIYVHGDYEIQVLDSFGVEKAGPGDMGGIYKVAAPADPLYKRPGEWQTFHIVFRAPRFDEQNRKTANAKFEKVVLNGRTIHENLEVTQPTPGGVDGKESPRGPLMFQGDHGAVAYRNITIRPLD